MSELKHYILQKPGGLILMPTLEDAIKSVKKGEVLWLNYCDPTKEELTSLSKPLDIHPLVIEDCLDENQIPKIEDYPRNTFILFDSFSYINNTLAVHEVDLIIGENYLVTVSGKDSNGKNVLSGVERLVEQDIESASQGPSFIAHNIIDSIVDQKFVIIDALEEELNRLEDIILEDHSKFQPADLVKLRRELLAVRKSLFHEREILIKITRKDSPHISDKAIIYYRDIFDHLTKFFELTESSRDLVTSLMEMYLSLLNNQLTSAANATNYSVRRLTVITTIFMPLTLLAGIGGMSEYSMMTGPHNWRIAYLAFLAVMILLGIINYFFIRWLEKRRSKKPMDI
jgi:magnesium transporter